jgi:hypothetical protein
MGCSFQCLWLFCESIIKTVPRENPCLPVDNTLIMQVEEADGNLCCIKPASINMTKCYTQSLQHNSALVTLLSGDSENTEPDIWPLQPVIAQDFYDPVLVQKKFSYNHSTAKRKEHLLHFIPISNNYNQHLVHIASNFTSHSFCITLTKPGRHI